MDYTDDFVTAKFGRVEKVSGNEFIAGSHIQLTIKIQIGTYGVDDGGHIKIAWPVSNSFGIPQFDDKTGENYTTISFTGEAKYEVKYESNGYIRPFMPCITIKIFDGYLIENDTLTVTFGDQSHGSPGYKAQTYVESNIEFKVLFDPFGANYYQRLPDSPMISIIAGKKSQLSILAQSQSYVGADTWYVIRAQDKFGNTAKDYNGEVERSIGDKSLGNYTFNPDDKGAYRENFLFDKAGIQFVKVTDENGIQYQSNPIEILQAQPSDLLYFGDLHGQTGETVGSGTIEEYFQFGLKEAGIDFISHAANAFQVTNEIWATLCEAVKRYNQDGRLVSYLGLEWSGNPGAGGDHNIYYLEDDQQIHRCSHALIDDKSDLLTDRYPVSELYNEFKGRDDVMIIPHIGGRKASLDVIDEKLTPFIEVVSVHGHFDWFVKEAIDRNLRVGFIGSSDTHSCRPGDSFPVSKIEAVHSGLTAVYAKELTRKGLWEGFRNRHVYATTGARIIVDFMANGKVMGDDLTSSSPITFTSKIIGTSPLEYVDLYCNHELIYSAIPKPHESNHSKLCIRWTGARVKTRRRNLDWSGIIEVENGSFNSVKQFAFDLPHEGIVKQSETLIEYISTTAGDYDGFIIDFNGNEKSILRFKNKQINVEISYDEISKGFKRELGDVEIGLEVFFMPSNPRKTQLEFKYTLQKIPDSKSAYYLRILQEDGEKAWTSPIFISS